MGKGQGASMPSPSATLDQSPHVYQLEALDKAAAALRVEIGWTLSSVANGQCQEWD